MYIYCLVEAIRAVSGQIYTGIRAQICIRANAFSAYTGIRAITKVCPYALPHVHQRYSNQFQERGHGHFHAPPAKAYTGIRAITSIRANPTIVLRTAALNFGNPSYPGISSYPGGRATSSIRASGHKHVAGHPGKIDYTGSRAKVPIRATGPEHVSWHIIVCGQRPQPGKLAESPIRASGQNPLYGHPGKRIHPGIRAGTYSWSTHMTVRVLFDFSFASEIQYYVHFSTTCTASPWAR